MKFDAESWKEMIEKNRDLQDDIKQLRIWIQEKDELIDSLKFELKSAYAKIDAVNLCSNLQGFKGREKS
jgi:predicted xylose isomerase-like sugar epimerase